MKEKALQEDYILDRKAASKLLKISMRTIDRYVKAKKVSSTIIDGRVWLSKSEIDDLKNKSGSRQKVDMSTSSMSIDSGVDNVDSVELLEKEYVNPVSTIKKIREEKGGVYKNLYEDLKKEIREKQERLEIANYRVGQLEAQVKSSIPMLEYHKENFERKEKENELNKKIKDQNFTISKMIRKIKYEKFNKRLFLIILLIVLALQPLWLILTSPFE
jgi:hypothetical protein